jgi:hypothetical protein
MKYEDYSLQNFKNDAILTASQLNHIEYAIKYNNNFFEWEKGGIVSSGAHALPGNEAGRRSIRTPRNRPFIGNDMYYTFTNNESTSIRLYVWIYYYNNY